MNSAPHWCNADPQMCQSPGIILCPCKVIEVVRAIGFRVYRTLPVNVSHRRLFEYDEIQPTFHDPWTIAAFITFLFLYLLFVYRLTELFFLKKKKKMFPGVDMANV